MRRHLYSLAVLGLLTLTLVAGALVSVAPWAWH